MRTATSCARYPVGIGNDGARRSASSPCSTRSPTRNTPIRTARCSTADDPLNPLGERWIDLGDGYGIHGTIDPDSIGKAELRGCIRMRASDVEEVYDLLTKGSEVIIRR